MTETNETITVKLHDQQNNVYGFIGFTKQDVAEWVYLVMRHELKLNFKTFFFAGNTKTEPTPLWETSWGAPDKEGNKKRKMKEALGVENIPLFELEGATNTMKITGEDVERVYTFLTGKPPTEITEMRAKYLEDLEAEKLRRAEEQRKVQEKLVEQGELKEPASGKIVDLNGQPLSST